MGASAATNDLEPLGQLGSGDHIQSDDSLARHGARPEAQSEARSDDFMAKAKALLGEGKTKSGERALKKLISREPQNIEALTILTAISLDRKDLDSARRTLGTALKHSPNTPDLHQLLGRLLTAQGRIDQAIGAFASAISLKPDLATAHRGLAPLLFQQKRYEEAGKSASIANQLIPNHAPTLLLLANIEQANKNFKETLEYLKVAQEADPRSATIARRLGETYAELGETNEAVTWAEKAWKSAPNVSINVLSYALSLDGAKQYKDVIAVLEPLLRKSRLTPREVAFAENLTARAMTHLGRREEALPHARRAIETAADNTTFASTYCRALAGVGRVDDAVAYAKSLRKRLPDNPGSAIVLAYTLRECGQHHLAEDLYLSVMNSPHKRSEAEFGLSMVQLSDGRYEEGFANYEARLEPPVQVIKVKPRLERWDGKPDPEVKLIVLREQGMGDEFQFTRFLPEARSRVGELHYITYSSMVQILSKAYPDVTVSGENISGKRGGNNKWRWQPLMSLPHTLGLKNSGIEVDRPYVFAEPDAIKKMAKKMRSGTFRVGVTWQGNPNSEVERGRSVPLADFAPLANIDGVHLYSLQKNHGLEQMKVVTFPTRLTDFGEEFDSGDGAFIDTAGAMMNLDLIVTSDTSIAHLAGALGRPTWVMLQHQAEWRWGLSGETTPWYPNTRLFRQPAVGDWKSAMADAAAELAKLVPPPTDMTEALTTASV